MIPPETPVGEMGERALLAHIRARIPQGEGVVLGVGDDAAAVSTGRLTLMTTDGLVEGVHFRREWSPPRLLGHKALTVNLSDVAAMAGIPRFATVSLCLPPAVTLGFVDGLYDGLLERAAETGVSLVGGNISAIVGPIVVDVALLGEGDRLLRRTGALPGDLAVVTGALGGAAEGLRLLAEGARLAADGSLESMGRWDERFSAALSACLGAYLDPAPPLAFARSLAEHDLVHAAIDLSDGLSGDLLTLCTEAQIGALVDSARVPVDPHVAALEGARGGDALSLALHGGEDYQLLMAVPPESLGGLQEVARLWELPLSVVGEFIAGPPSLTLKAGGAHSSLIPASFDHLRPRPPEPTSMPKT